jgi:hypothetical protein
VTWLLFRRWVGAHNLLDSKAVFRIECKAWSLLLAYA